MTPLLAGKIRMHPNSDFAVIHRMWLPIAMSGMKNAPTEIVHQFNDCITQRDAARLSGFLAEDHVFVDNAGNMVSGKQDCIAAWSGFFDAFPDYYNVLDRVEDKHKFVAVAGHSICSDARLHGPALWKAVVAGEVIAEWHVLDDTEENRRLLGLATWV